MKVNFKKFSVNFKKVANDNFDSEKFWPIFMMSLALFLMVSFGPDLIEYVKADTSGVSLSVTISPTLSFTMDATSKAFGALSPGTPQQATSTLFVLTNNSIGFYTSINRASTTYALFSGSQTIADTPNGNNWTAPTATSTAGPSAVWTTATTVGLGFRVMVSTDGVASTTCGASSTWWGSDDGATNAKWSGISTSTPAQKIADCGYYRGGGTGQTVIYKLDVNSSQAGGTYQSSPVTFTVLTN